MERLALISDIHANITALDAVLSDINNAGCKKVLCCGDLVGYGPHPNEVIERFRELNIPTVMGNYDEAVGFLLPACGCSINNLKHKNLSNNSLKWTTANTSSENRRYLRELPEHIEFCMGRESIFIVHSSPDSMTEYIFERDYDRLNEILNNVDQRIYAYGHTHFPFIQSVDNKLIINAGSVGRPKNCDNRATYVLLEIDENSGLKGTIRKVMYDVEKVAFAIKKSGLDNYFAEFIKNGGDIEEGCNNESDCSCTLD